MPYIAVAILLITSFCWHSTYAQQYKKRTYANFQGVYRTGVYALHAETVFGSVVNASAATDGNAQNASTLNIPLGLVGTTTVTQFLEFTTNGSHNNVRSIPANTPVAVKFKIPASILGLLDGVEVGTFTGLNEVPKKITGLTAYLGTGSGNSAGYNASNKYAAYSSAALLNALNGSGELELNFTPSQIYHGVYLKLSGNGLSVALTTEVFHAYILEDAPVDCNTINTVVDVLSGVKGNSLVNAASATGAVAAPWSAVDADASLSTFSTLSTGVQVLSNVFQTVVFSTTSRPGDSAKIIIQDPGAQLLDLSLLKGFSIQPYLGNTAVGSPITNNSALLVLRLLSGGSNKYELSAAVPVAFDRIEIMMGGVADALTQIRIYNISRVVPRPVITSDAFTTTADTLYVVRGNQLTLNAAPVAGADGIKWYNNNGQWLSDGGSYQIASVQQDGLYYARASRSGCVDNTQLHAVYVKVLSAQILPDFSIRLSGRQDTRMMWLSWTVNDELDVVHYEIEKSSDGLSFTAIGSVTSLRLTSSSYQFADKTPYHGNNFYRLVIYSANGEKKNSKVIQLVYGDTRSAVLVATNPVYHQMNLHVSGAEKGRYQLELRNLHGVLIHSTPVTVTGASYTGVVPRPKNIIPGLYLLSFYDEQHQIIQVSKTIFK